MSAAAADDQPGPSGRHHASPARVTPGYTAPPAAAAGAAAVGAADATPPTAAAAAGGGGGAPAAAAADGGGSGGGGDKRSRSAEEAELGRDSRCGAAAAGGGRAQQQEQREEQREQRPARWGGGTRWVGTRRMLQQQGMQEGRGRVCNSTGYAERVCQEQQHAASKRAGMHTGRDAGRAGRVLLDCKGWCCFGGGFSVQLRPALPPPPSCCAAAVCCS
jgi:hypothetical protein